MLQIFNIKQRVASLLDAALIPHVTTMVIGDTGPRVDVTVARAHVDATNDVLRYDEARDRIWVRTE